MTDSEAEVRYGEDKPGISNLMEIYGCVTRKDLRRDQQQNLPEKVMVTSSWPWVRAVADELGPTAKAL